VGSDRVEGQEGCRGPEEVEANVEGLERGQAWWGEEHPEWRAELLSRVVLVSDRAETLGLVYSSTLLWKLLLPLSRLVPWPRPSGLSTSVSGYVFVAQHCAAC